MSVKILLAYDFSQEIKLLFSEYTDMLIEGDPSFKKYLEIQHYDDELKHLEKKYGLPYGRLYLAYYNNEVAGCIGLKKIDEKNCEMKRLYVRPKFRGKQIGEQLIEKIIKAAKEIGYSYMLLDTLPFLKGAIYLYKNMGFMKLQAITIVPWIHQFI